MEMEKIDPKQGFPKDDIFTCGILQHGIGPKVGGEKCESRDQQGEGAEEAQAGCTGRQGGVRAV